MGEMTEAEAAMMLAGALQTDLIYRLDLLHEAGAPKLILAATLLDLALQLIRAEQGAGAEQMVRELCEQLLRAADRPALRGMAVSWRKDQRRYLNQPGRYDAGCPGSEACRGLSRLSARRRPWTGA
jgi:hypothetical protein